MKTQNFKHLPLYTIVFILFLCSSLQLTAQRYAKEVPPHYVFPEFIEGKVVMKTAKINTTLLNYNNISEEMIFEKSGKKLALYKLETIDTVIIMDRKFIPMGKVFYEIVFEGPTSLFIQHKSKVTSEGKPVAYGGKSQVSATDSYSHMLTSFGAYELKLPDEYRVTDASVFWIRSNGIMHDFKTNQQI